MKPILKLAQAFEIKLAQMQAKSAAELAKHILSLYHGFGLAERTNALSYMDEQAFKTRVLNLIVYQTAHQQSNWISQFTNHLSTNIERFYPGLTKNIQIYHVKTLQRPNLPLNYKPLEDISIKVPEQNQAEELDAETIQELEQLGISEDQIQSLNQEQIESLIEERIRLNVV